MPFATRFAPSPTGRLHLGHAYSALTAADRARAAGGHFLLRIDDIDPGRVRADYRAAIDTDLMWLGLIPDAPPLEQSSRTAAYSVALDNLRARQLIYPCFCTRADIAAEIAASAAAPHGSSPALYPGTCRAIAPDVARARIARGATPAWRLDVASAMLQTGPLYWMDDAAGPIAARPELLGDVVLARRDAPASYHLASTLDDAAMAISHVVRGIDLAPSTHVHRLLQALLDLPSPVYVHHRLVGDVAGRRLAKRSDAASIHSLRQQGFDPAALTGRLRAGMLPLGYCWIDA